jgi:hypothetical protein
MVIVFLVLLLVTKILKPGSSILYAFHLYLKWCNEYKCRKGSNFPDLSVPKIKFVKVILTPSMRSSHVKDKFNNCYFLFSPIVNMFVTSHLGMNYIKPVLNFHELPTTNVSCNNLSLAINYLSSPAIFILVLVNSVHILSLAIITSLPLPYLCQF